jgi:hypothetical protein
MLIFRTKRVIYRVETNEDGTLTVFKEYQCTKNMNVWEYYGKEYQDAGMLIKQQGGREAFLDRCEYVDSVRDIISILNAEKVKGRIERINQELEMKKKAEEAYEQAFNQEVTESNAENIYILLRYLNTQNWGLWRLPKMTIGYACNQYDCDGKTATVIKLDQPIKVGGRMGTKFQYGAPRGHLTKYERIVNWE